MLTVPKSSIIEEHKDISPNYRICRGYKFLPDGDADREEVGDKLGNIYRREDGWW